MRSYLLVCFFILAFCDTANSQSVIDGSWYTFSRNRVIEITITKDSLINRQLNWDLSPRINSRNYKSAGAIETIIKDGDIVYFQASDSITDSWQRVFHAFKIIRPGKEIMLSPISYKCSGTNSLIFTAVDTTQTLGLILFSTSELNRLKSQPSVDSITLQDFRKYIDLYLQNTTKMKELEKRGESPSNLLYYGYFSFRNLFGEVGYNPLITEEQLERLIKRFQADSEGKKLLEHLDLK